MLGVSMYDVWLEPVAVQCTACKLKSHICRLVTRGTLSESTGPSRWCSNLLGQDPALKEFRVKSN